MPAPLNLTYAFSQRKKGATSKKSIAPGVGSHSAEQQAGTEEDAQRPENGGKAVDFFDTPQSKKGQ